MMHTTRRRLAAVFLLLGVLAVAGPIACGKRGDPKPPEGAPSTHPRSYPTG